MKISSYRCETGFFKFKVPMPWYGRNIGGKHRLKLTLFFEDAAPATGEIAIPEFCDSEELQYLASEISDVLDQRLSRDFSTSEINLEAPGLGNPLFHHSNQSLCWLLEHAYFNYALANALIPHLKKQKLQSRFASFPLNSITPSDHTNIVKIKIPQDPDDVLRLIENIQNKRSEKNIKFRLDGNRQLSPQAFSSLLIKLRGQNIEYIEEPCSDISRVESIFPLAADESFAEAFDRHYPNFESIIDDISDYQYVVLKPTQLPSPSVAFRTLRILKEKGIKVILSCSYDPPGTIPLLLAMAHTVGNEINHGFGPVEHYSSLGSNTSISGNLLCHHLAK